MKKTLSLLLVFILALAAAAVPASADSELQQVLASVKERIAPTDGFETFNSETDDDSGNITYNFYWESSSDGNYKDMSVTALSDGTITQYCFYDDSVNYYSGKATINKPTYAQALSKAQELFKKLNPSLYDHVTITPQQKNEDFENGVYSFYVQRVENGIPVAGDDGYLSVSPDLLSITDFYITYTRGVTFPKPENVIGTDAAKKAFAEKIGMKLTYRTDYDYKEKTRTVYTVYVPGLSDTYIDAFTGESHKAERLGFYPMREELSAGDSVDYKKADFSEAELTELDNVSGLMSIESIDKAVRANSVINITKKMTRSSCSLYKDSFEKDRYYYNLAFDEKSGDEGVRITADAKTGEIYSFYRYGEYSDKVNVKPEKAKDIAVSAAQKLAPAHVKADGTGDYLFDGDNLGNKYGDDYSFTFTRTVNSISFPEDSITVSVDPSTGKISNYYFNFSNIDFPPLDKCITAEEACEKLFEYRGMELEYIPELGNNDNEYDFAVDKMTLVYSPDEKASWVLDAESGKPDEDEEIVIPEYTDISGHYGEDAINRLREYGIGFSTDSFEPNKPITQKEFANLLVHVFNWRSPVIIDDEETSDYSYAKRRGIIKDENVSDRSITRLEAATYIIRAMGIEEYAMLKGIYVSPFNDVPEESIGITAILSAMKVINGSSGSFNPQGTLSRADAMIMVYNYLNS